MLQTKHYKIISIHAPREGGDVSIVILCVSQYIISIHAPREGGDPVQGAASAHIANFNPRPPRGGRRRVQRALQHDRPISIHAPREGGDSKDAQFYQWIFDK